VMIPSSEVKKLLDLSSSLLLPSKCYVIIPLAFIKSKDSEVVVIK
jgi:hypothetical protein